eukprot:GHVP01023340.1.p2 GENE.GHVP01023340.1~~GHVP01023340.1.p2  ORF type:complete len:650 (-),score=168.40 GHVP01023340.1:5363-7312(-)
MNGKAPDNRYFLKLVANSGPLSSIWLACHCERRLKDKHALGTDILKVVEAIRSLLESNEMGAPLGIEKSGGLLVGTVRVWARQLDHFLGQCSEVYSRMQMSGTQKSRQKFDPKKKARATAINSISQDIGLDVRIDLWNVDELLEEQFVLTTQSNEKKQAELSNKNKNSKTKPLSLPENSYNSPLQFSQSPNIPYELLEFDRAIDFAGDDSSYTPQAEPLHGGFSDIDMNEEYSSPIERLRGEASTEGARRAGLEEEFTARRIRAPGDNEREAADWRRSSVNRLTIDAEEAMLDFDPTEEQVPIEWRKMEDTLVDTLSSSDFKGTQELNDTTTTASEDQHLKDTQDQSAAFPIETDVQSLGEENTSSDDDMKNGDEEYEDLGIPEGQENDVVKKKKKKPKYLQLKIDDATTLKDGALLASSTARQFPKKVIPEVEKEKALDYVGVLRKLHTRVGLIEKRMINRRKFAVLSEKRKVPKKKLTIDPDVFVEMSVGPEPVVPEPTTSKPIAAEPAAPVALLPVAPDHTEIVVESSGALDLDIEETLEDLDIGGQSDWSCDNMSNDKETAGESTQRDLQGENTTGENINKGLTNNEICVWCETPTQKGLGAILKDANALEASRVFFRLLEMRAKKEIEVHQIDAGNVKYKFVCL